MRKATLLVSAALALFVASQAAAQTFNLLHSFNLGYNGAWPGGPLVLSGNTLYGATQNGGSTGNGTVFSVNADGSGFTTLHSFTNGSGPDPRAGLLLSGNTLYGTTPSGGSSGNGSVFKVNTDGTGFAVLHSFSASSDGSAPEASLVLSGNTLYGTASQGGVYGGGAVFAVNTDGTGFTNIHSLAFSEGNGPNGVVLSGNRLYGTAANGGIGSGTVFALNTDGAGFAVLYNFTVPGPGATNSDGYAPLAALTLSGDTLYGTASAGGSSGNGTVFALNTDGSGFKNLHSFGGDTSGSQPSSVLTLSGNRLYGTTTFTTMGGDSTLGNGTAFAINTDGADFTVLHDFVNNDGIAPNALVVTEATIYGTAIGGGVSEEGTLFTLNTNGSGFTNAHNFAGSDGAQPESGLTLSGNSLYGTSLTLGASGGGTVFTIGLDGAGFGTLHAFTTVGNIQPNAALASSGGVLFGRTFLEGKPGGGAVFSVNSDGTDFTNLYTFPVPSNSGPLSHSQHPNSFPALVSAGNTLYGASFEGGPSEMGSLFAMSTDGSGFTNIYNFSPGIGSVATSNPDGAGPSGLLFSGGTLYGTAEFGGTNGNGTVFSVNTDGSDFHVLHTFAPVLTPGAATNSDGAFPTAGLVLLGDTLYGTAQYGGAAGYGTVFSIRTNGSSFTTLYSFTNGVDGANPAFGVIVSGHTLYGTAQNGGAPGHGTVFALNTDGSGFTTVYSFTNGVDGANPTTGLIVSGNSLYGTTAGGGYLGLGAVYSISFTPQLGAAPSGTSLQLSWPTNIAGFDYAGYTLQSTTNLLPSAGWSVVPGAPVVVNGLNTVTTPLSGSQSFYRLTK